MIGVILLLLLTGIGGYLSLIQSSFPQVDDTVTVPGLESRVEVYRDQSGIPHIYADSVDDLFFAQGYVTAQDRLWQMEFQRRVGHGRLSEILGEATLDVDRFLRTIGLSRAAAADLEVIDEETRRILDAYARGVTAFIQTHRGRFPLEFKLLGFQPEPWRPIDSVVWGKVMAWTLGDNWNRELLRARLIRALEEEQTSELLPPYREAGPLIVPPEVKRFAELGDPALDGPVFGFAGADSVPGSNNWVVDGTKSATGKPLLANDPHLGIQMPSIWYEVGLHGGGFDVVGANLPGTPGVVIGYNRRIAWGVTNVGPDVQDLFIERINPENPNQYEFRGQWEEMEIVREPIVIKGREEPEILEVRITRHGPIINDVVSDLEQPLAFRWTATSSPNQLLRSVLRLDRARTWEEFRNALRDFDAPSQNFVYADIDGNIGYQMPGLIPIRARGRGLVPVPGWTGEYEWEGYVPFDELPSIFNPPTGYIATANNQVVPDDYPYFISAEWAAPYRAERIIALLTETETLSIEDFERIQADTYSILVERLVPHLLAIEPGTELETKALERLRGWDFRYKLDSVGASIFEMTYLKLVENTFADELGEELFGDYLGRSSFHALTLERLIEDRESRWFDDVSTPEVEDREAILNRSFEQGIEMLQDQLGEDPDRWSWGRLHRSTFEHPLGVSVLSRIFNRGPVPSRGGVFTIDRAAFSYRNPFSTTSLSSYRQIVDLGALGNSQSIHTTGQSGQPYYKHYSDLIDPWQAVAYHPMYFDRETIEAEQEALLILIPG